VSDFSVKNLMEIENSAPEELADRVTVRFSRKYLDSEHLGVSHFRYGPNFRSELGHHHREQEEAYVVVAGSGRAKLGDEVIELKLWDVVRVAPSTVRAFEGGPEGIELIAIGSDRPEGGDGVRDSDFWVN
jgi:mannose-6-phosphate isomerase-like protein (cupin superfamily)